MNNVHIGVLMNTIVTSKEEILINSKRLIQKNGIERINIRSVAKACGVAVGSIYNYFDSKTDLLRATVESVWYEIFHSQEEKPVFQETQSFIIWMYKQLEVGCKKYPEFFSIHSLGFVSEEDKDNGKRLMEKTWTHIFDELCSVLKKDPNIREKAFTKEFTVEDFARILFSLMLSALLLHDYNSHSVLEIIRRTIY